MLLQEQRKRFPLCMAYTAAKASRPTGRRQAIAGGAVRVGPVLFSMAWL